MAPSGKGRPRKGKGMLNPQTEHILTQEQSVELMGIVAVAAISRICYARNVFPNLPYAMRYFDPNNPETSYEDFVHRDTDNLKMQTDQVHGWKLLPRNDNEKVDKLLDWIENAVLETIRLGYLAGFQLTVHSSDNGPITQENLLECYNFELRYGPEGAIDVNRRQSYGSRSENQLVSAARGKIYHLVNEVRMQLSDQHNTGSGIVDLPSKCRLGMTLSYNETTPAGYQAPMFKPGNEDTQKIVNSGEVYPELTVHTGHHSLSTGWRYRTRSATRRETSQVTQPEVVEEFKAMASIYGYVLQTISADAEKGLSRDVNGVCQDTQPLTQRKIGRPLLMSKNEESSARVDNPPTESMGKNSPVISETLSPSSHQNQELGSPQSHTVESPSPVRPVALNTPTPLSSSEALHRGRVVGKKRLAPAAGPVSGAKKQRQWINCAVGSPMDLERN